MIYLHTIRGLESEVTEPVTLAEVKSWLRIDATDTTFNEELTRMLTGARQTIENYTGIALVNKTLSFYAEVEKEWDTTLLPLAGTLSAIVVKKLVEGEADETLTAGEDYYIKGGVLKLSQGNYSFSAEVTANVPEALKEAIKMEVAERFNSRGENIEGAGLSQAAKQKAFPYRTIWH